MSSLLISLVSVRRDMYIAAWLHGDEIDGPLPRAYLGKYR